MNVFRLSVIDGKKYILFKTTSNSFVLVPHYFLDEWLTLTINETIENHEYYSHRSFAERSDQHLLASYTAHSDDDGGNKKSADSDQKPDGNFPVSLS